ncbi:hypothetical protein BU25DRAFT_450113 [Macroventuria anomochaeta]|uniref:Uncharacterized protein n=1 Tax=Macroventuria anomochaeta TaxID=301207 RepID=A0ACB6RTH5_9PLEO|nr:uncharacterized protein BU25DRAFT_450113 [Macroventuria anomochaeta]KAF2625356.1 hypothetical protein BU25DRAFT_450113 [Macroventuria anomochaeta]
MNCESSLTAKLYDCIRPRARVRDIERDAVPSTDNDYEDRESSSLSVSRTLSDTTLVNTTQPAASSTSTQPSSTPVPKTQPLPGPTAVHTSSALSTPITITKQDKEANIVQQANKTATSHRSMRRQHRHT